MVLGLAGGARPGGSWIGFGAAASSSASRCSARGSCRRSRRSRAPLERLRGVPGRLARENAVRNPGRTAATAAALMIGLALVSFVERSSLPGFRGSIDSAIEKTGSPAT